MRSQASSGREKKLHVGAKLRTRNKRFSATAVGGSGKDFLQLVIRKAMPLQSCSLLAHLAVSRGLHFMQEHPLIELYVNVGSEQQNTLIEQQLSSVDLDRVALQTLQAVDIDQQVMFTLLVTDDESIRDMNKQYRDQDKPTDVLSFPLLQEPLVNAPVDQLWSPTPAEDASSTTEQPAQGFVTPPGMVTNLGDIVMSWPTITRQAIEAGHEPLVELLYLLSHGLLHLVGYDDHTEAGYQAMVHIQQTVLQALGYQG